MFFLSLLEELENVNFIRTHYHWNLIKDDSDDNKFVDCAINAGVDYIATEDKHFHILKNIDFPPTNVIGIDEFLEILKKI